MYHVCRSVWCKTGGLVLRWPLYTMNVRLFYVLWMPPDLLHQCFWVLTVTNLDFWMWISLAYKVATSILHTQLFVCLFLASSIYYTDWSVACLTGQYCVHAWLGQLHSFSSVITINHMFVVFVILMIITKTSLQEDTVCYTLI